MLGMRVNILLFVMALVIVAAVFLYIIHTNKISTTYLIKNTSAINSTTVNNNSTATKSSNPNAIKLVNSQYASISYKIFPGPQSAQSLKALIGIEMSNITISNGTKIELSMNNNPISNVYVPKNDSLYFIEASYGDDFGSYEGSLGDDGIILVNSSGYIIG
jgi:hypothetical protein